MVTFEAIDRVLPYASMTSRTLKASVLVVLLPSGLLVLASSFVELLKRFEGRTDETLQIATVAHLVRCVGIGTVVNCTHCRQAEKVKTVSASHQSGATNPSVARGGRFAPC